MRTICSGTIATDVGLEDNLSIISGLGFKEMDLLLVTGWAHVGLDELAADYAAVCGRIERLLIKYDLSIGAVNAKFSVRLEDGGEEQCLQRQNELDAMLHFMKDFGTIRASIQPTLINDTAYLGRTYEAFVAEAVRQQEYASERGMLLSLEPHIMSSVCTNAALEKLLAIHPDFHITYDPSHLLHSGEDILSTGYLFPASTMVHLRDARKGELFVRHGMGGLNLPFVIAGLGKAGYDGPVSLEYLSGKWDSEVYDDLAKFAAEINDCILQT